jgi:hypothetical protein
MLGGNRMSRDLDSGMLQYVPKGAYYEEKDEQFNAVKKMWDGLFEYDRALFALTSILNGTGFSKGAMAHKLLSNPLFQSTGKELVPDGLDSDFERKVIEYNLEKLADKQMARALRNLLMLTGGELHSRVNNSRTRKIILGFLFDRDPKELDSLAVNFKGKLAKLVRHALGKQDLFKILNGDMPLFNKKIGKYNQYAFPVVCHLFNRIPAANGEIRAHLPQIDLYWKAKAAAQMGNVKEFEKLIIKLPWRVAMGFRNSYKLPVEKSAIMGEAKMSNKEELTMEAAVKRSGAKKRNINYKAQDLYDLWKALYFKMANDDQENIDDIAKALDEKTEQLSKLGLGDKCAVILDASHSMFGSDERPMHPFLTGLCVIGAIENVQDVFVVGGRWKEMPDTDKRVVFPANASPLWKGLVKAVESGAENIVIISDGYENAVKGMFEHVYKHFKASGHEFNVIHINPVFSADSKSGSSRKLAEDVTPMPVGSYKYLETEFIFNQMIENTEVVKQLLIQKYQKLIGGS